MTTRTALTIPCPFGHDHAGGIPLGFPCDSAGVHDVDLAAVIRWLARKVPVIDVPCTCETYGYCQACR